MQEEADVGPDHGHLVAFWDCLDSAQKLKILTVCKVCFGVYTAHEAQYKSNRKQQSMLCAIIVSIATVVLLSSILMRVRANALTLRCTTHARAAAADLWNARFSKMTVVCADGAGRTVVG
jgi:hypothetical protein